MQGNIKAFIKGSAPGFLRHLPRDKRLERLERPEGPAQASELMAVRYAPDGQLTFVNKAYCRYYGKRPEEVLGRNFIQYRVPMDDLLRISRAVSTLSPLMPERGVRHEVVLADGRVRNQVWVHKALFDADGNLREFVASGMDVTSLDDDGQLRTIEKKIKDQVNALCEMSKQF